MEMHLANRRFFVGEHFTIADIALYAYTHVANRCDFDLTRFPAVRDWLDRIAAEPGHVSMEWQPALTTAH
jgi:glutathione S-transferase